MRYRGEVAVSSVSMRPLLGIGMLVLAAGAAAAAPAKHVFRELQSHEVWHTSDRPDQLRTFTIEIDGGHVSVRIETATRKGTGWSKPTTTVVEGRASKTDDGTTLELGQGAETSTFACGPAEVQIAAATARRVATSAGEGMLGGRWTGSLSKVRALVCVSDLPAAPLPSVLVLAARPIEHVIADDNCCEKPGDSLRAISADRSVRPLTR